MLGIEQSQVGQASASTTPLALHSVAVADATTSTLAPEEYYHKVWKLVDDNFLYRERLGTWNTWEHKYDGKLNNMTDAEKAVSDMLGSLGDRSEQFGSAVDSLADLVHGLEARKEDLSNEPPDTELPDAVLTGAEPFLIVGAMAGG